MSENYDKRTDAIKICVDCAHELANGETTDGADPNRVVRDIGEITLDDCDEPHFGWYFCARCDTKLGGDRYPATVRWDAELADGETYPTHKDVDMATQAALVCLLWSECVDDMGTSLLASNYDVTDINENDAMQVRQAVGQFLLDMAENGLLAAYRAGQDMVQFGHDWVLTRNHHGAGFWDRGLGDLGKQITDLVQPYGEITAYVADDGSVRVDL